MSEAVIAAVAGLRATRAFDPEGPDEVTVRRVLEAARWTGSARNRQPWRLVVARDVGVRARFAALGAYAGPLVAAPVAVLLAGDLRTGGADLDFDLGRLAQGLMLAARAVGLGSCPVTFFPDANVERARVLAGLDEGWRIRTAIALGRPAAAPPATGRRVIPSGRRPLDEIVVDLDRAAGV
ncbi:MAG TPA: nitroreductase family protein [Baekduia sp.]|uniref:nitroreductase family protein n=1 Tax=Baekduia sp. TaxID=2600305 RepID=UPI002D775B0A|nr:nitroreductase family protein [Baekduia sp.]HET6508005.1 nitroreductase family protein [Baekduia sp.]